MLEIAETNSTKSFVLNKSAKKRTQNELKNEPEYTPECAKRTDWKANLKLWARDRDSPARGQDARLTAGVTPAPR